NMHWLDRRFGLLLTRHSILALVCFTAEIWILELPSQLNGFALFSLLPTLRDFIFLMLFVGHLTIVWTFAFDAQRPIYRSDISRGEYVYSNLSFSLPVLLPWALMFGILDLLRLLPFEFLKHWIDSAIGQSVTFLLFLVVATILAPVMIQRFWRCRPLEPSALRQRIEALCRTAGVRYADIVYWPIFGGRMITAAVMGLVGRFRYILVTDALLRLLTPDELDQVIAHEIGHVKRNHLLLYLIFLLGFMLISYAAYPLSLALMLVLEPAQKFMLMMKINPEGFSFALYAVLLVFGVLLYFRYIFGFFIRNFERQADLFIFRLFPTAQPLISTFDKIVLHSGQPADKPNWHHFSIQERIDYLRLCENAPNWIQRHDRKVRNAIALFLAGLTILTFGVLQLNDVTMGQGGTRLDLAVIENYLESRESHGPEDALLYGLAGNLHLERQELGAAMVAYKKAVLLNPNQPDILNNLAWLLATSTDPIARDPQQALLLAQRALHLKNAPHIWDTLAEALYANGRIEEAIQAEEKALSMNPEEKHIYEEQLAKFKKGKE
ncbi:MAG: M48 family metalloprotease, partial [Desulfatitalea sp.]|nr:M48 family metalloprotease [Desulfatitalea sp.]